MKTENTTPAHRPPKKASDELTECRAQLMRIAVCIEASVGQARAAAATLPILQALGEVEAMRREAERRETLLKDKDREIRR